jgi:hypothetical protein
MDGQTLNETKLTADHVDPLVVLCDGEAQGGPSDRRSGMQSKWAGRAVTACGGDAPRLMVQGQSGDWKPLPAVQSLVVSWVAIVRPARIRPK